MLMNFDSSLIWKFSLWVSASIYWTRVRFWIYERVSEGCFVWWVVRMVIWMSLWLSFGAISSGSRIQCVVLLRNVNSIKSGRCHCLWSFVDSSSCKHISTLFSESFLQKLIGLYVWHISLISWNYHIFSFNRLSLFGHIVIWCSIHIARSPLEEILFTNSFRSLMVIKAELVLRLSKVGVIKSWSIQTHI